MYTDEKTFASSGTTYYRCIAASGPAPPGPAPGPSSKYKCSLLKRQCAVDPEGKFATEAECEKLCG